MQIIKSNIVKIPKYDRIQGLPVKESVYQDIRHSLQQKMELGISLNDYLFLDKDCDNFWDEYRAEFIILSVDEYEKLKGEK
jgi:hypothetical protein